MKAAWYPDPTGHGELRYWDGSVWTEHIATNGVTSTAPLTRATPPAESAEIPTESGEIPTESAEIPTESAFGSESAIVEQEPASAVEPVETPDSAVVSPDSAVVSPDSVAVSPDSAVVSPDSAGAGIEGELIDGRYAEIDGVGPANQNPRLLRVRLGEPFMARQGSMVAYQGQVDFAYQGGGMSRFMKKAFTGEGLSLMQVTGSGDVFIANTSFEVHLLRLTNAGISINGENVLAFGGQLDWNVERVKGGSMMTGGLFNTTLRGSGWVAITTDGPPVVLNAGEAATFADSNAIVAWSADLTTSVRSTMTAGAMIGRGSGEALQVAFSGNGFVIVQPSEGRPVAPPR